MPEERPVANPKLMGRPVDEKAEEPTSGETPVDDEAYEPMPESRPVADPRLVIRPVDVMAYEPTPRDVPVVNQTIMRRPADGEKSIPTTEGRPAAGPKTIIRPKEGEVDPEAVPLLHKAPPPSEVPEWSDGEVMPLIIIEHNSGVVIPKTTDGRVPVSSASRYYPAPAAELRRLQQPVLRSTNCVCSVSEYLGDGYNDDCAHL